MLNMFRMLIHPSSGACDLCAELFYGLYWSGSMCVGRCGMAVVVWYPYAGWRLLLVYDGREIVRSLYSGLQGQTVYGGYGELAGSLFVSVKIDGLGNVLEKWRCKLWHLLDILNLARKIYNIRHAWTLKEISKTREGVHAGDDIETTLHKWKPMALKWTASVV